MGEFPRLAGIALIVFAVCGPLAYCTAAIDSVRVETRDLMLACISLKGEWSSPAWSLPRCTFLNATENASGRPEDQPATLGPKE